ncbi:thiosulfate dehydrogenase [quinone] large subunit [Kibdelosporangium banguiense]|uniref:Thiosulfate dehydrogenase [quinone] large subunit n=1 Tax=Kibdelosporangium banguiense TaxID=1365924 RepID=A0ABS4TWK3_9PSEU|nr:thiosulfate dehydrogenase [quinone] large subunit [Kibdelosporangium banguiense]
MSIHEAPVNDCLQVSPHQAADTAPAHGAVMTTTAGKVTAILRITTGLVFLWAFLDKTFGLGYATGSANAWINGGSPTKGFLSRVDVGPFSETLRGWAGGWLTDWLFMLGLLGIGLAVTLGIGLRISAIAGTIMMLMMWVAEWPLDRFNEAGQPTMSTNPILDYHLLYAIVLIALAVTYAGNTWGFGRKWAELGIVRKNHWLI